MKVVVVDLEFNQPSEKIIQIGAVQLDCKTGVINNQFNIFVNPKEIVSEYITTLTGITQRDVDSGVSLDSAINQFWEYVGSKAVAAWGRDIEVIEKTSFDLGINFKVSRKLDVKTWGNIMRCVLPNSKAKSGGLKPTMDAFGVDFIGRQHNALDDAENTARLMWRWISASRFAEEIFTKSSVVTKV